MKRWHRRSGITQSKIVFPYNNPSLSNLDDLDGFNDVLTVEYDEFLVDNNFHHEERGRETNDVVTVDHAGLLVDKKF